MEFLDRRLIEFRAGCYPNDEASLIVIDGARNKVSGRYLEDAVRLDQDDPIRGYLFFLTDDVPFEDVLSITLTDTRLQILDCARIGQIYASGEWRSPIIDGPGQLSFSFMNRKRWHLAVAPKPLLRWPGGGEPRGVRRGLTLRRHFTLSQE